MQPCRWYQLEFPATLSGELCHEQADRVRLHVESCRECSEELERFRMVESLLSAGLPEPERVDEFQQSFLERLETEIRREKQVRRRRFMSEVFHPALLPLAAAAGLAALLVWRWPVGAPGAVPQTGPAAPVVAEADIPGESVEAAAPVTAPGAAVPGADDSAVRSVAASPAEDSDGVTPVADAIVEPVEPEAPAEAEMTAETELQQGASLGRPARIRPEYTLRDGPDTGLRPILVADRGS